MALRYTESHFAMETICHRGGRCKGSKSLPKFESFANESSIDYSQENAVLWKGKKIFSKLENSLDQETHIKDIYFTYHPLYFIIFNISRKEMYSKEWKETFENL